MAFMTPEIGQDHVSYGEFRPTLDRYNDRGIDRQLTEVSVDTPYKTHDDTPRIILIRPTKDIVRNKKEQQKKRRFCPKCFEVKLAQKIRINIAMTSVSGWTFKSPRNRRPRRTLVIPSDPSEVICFNCKLRHKQLCITFPTSLFTVPYFFVRSFRYIASYRHGYCTEGAGVGDCSFLPNRPRPLS